MVEDFVLLDRVVAEDLVVVQQIFVTAMCLSTAEYPLQEVVVGLDGVQQLVQQLLEVMVVMGVVADQETAVLPQIVRVMGALLQQAE